REQRPVDHQVRPCLHQGSIFVAQWLALGTVRQHDRAPGGPLGDASPLAADGKGGPTSAQEPTRLQFGDQLAGWDGGQRPEALLMRREAFGPGCTPDQLHFWACGEGAGTCRHAEWETAFTRQATAATTLP